MKPLRIAAVSCCLFLLAGCGKSIDNTSPTAKKLVAGRWQVSASFATMRYNGKDSTFDYYALWRACEQDDYIEFTEDGRGTQNENTNKCTEDNEVDNFVWELRDNDTKLHVAIGGNLQAKVFELMEVTDTQIKWKITDSISGQPATIVETRRNVK